MRAADWNEIRTCAVEVRAILLLRVPQEQRDQENLTIAGALGGNVTFFPVSFALEQAERLLWCETTYHLARHVLAQAQ